MEVVKGQKVGKWGRKEGKWSWACKEVEGVGGKWVKRKINERGIVEMRGGGLEKKININLQGAGRS